MRALASTSPRRTSCGAFGALCVAVGLDGPQRSGLGALRGRHPGPAPRRSPRRQPASSTLEPGTALEDAEIAAALEAHPAARRWRPWLRRVRLARPHELLRARPGAAAVARQGVSAVANWVRLYDETLAKLQVRAGRESLTLAEALNRMSDAEPARRRAAAQGLARALTAKSSTLALSLNTLAFEKQVEDRWRRYADARRHPPCRQRGRRRGGGGAGGGGGWPATRASRTATSR